MSQRLGMADGRCFTINTSSRLLNNYIMTNNGVDYVDNDKYRQLLQSKGPELIDMVVFHSDCLQRWKDQGKNTCPTCRKVFDVSNFKVTLTVENNYNTTSNVISMNEDMIFNVMDIFDISFDVEDVLDLDALLLDIGSSLADIDPLVLHTE